MTDLTARELLDTILRSWEATRTTFKKATRSTTDEGATLQPTEKTLVGRTRPPIRKGDKTSHTPPTRRRLREETSWTGFAHPSSHPLAC
jgi:hypothetical protein